MDPIEMIDARLTRLEDKMDKLLAFKWQIIGGSVVLSLFLTVALHVVEIMTTAH